MKKEAGESEIGSRKERTAKGKLASQQGEEKSRQSKRDTKVGYKTQKIAGK